MQLIAIIDCSYQIIAIIWLLKMIIAINWLQGKNNCNNWLQGKIIANSLKIHFYQPLMSLYHEIKINKLLIKNYYSLLKVIF